MLRMMPLPFAFHQGPIWEYPDDPRLIILPHPLGFKVGGWGPDLTQNRLGQRVVIVRGGGVEGESLVRPVGLQVCCDVKFLQCGNSVCVKVLVQNRPLLTLGPAHWYCG